MALYDKMLAMEKILLENIPNKDKVIGASRYLSGLELTKLSAPIARKVKMEAAYLNSILKLYPITTFDDYDLISTKHLEEIVGTLNRICQRLKKFSKTNFALMRGL